MKKAAMMLVFLALFVTAFAGSASAASKTPKLYLNGQELQSASAPRIEKDITYIPIRTVAEGMGFDVNWDKAAKQVSIHNGKSMIELTINKKIATVNGLSVALPTPAKIMGAGSTSTTMVPLRFISENMGLEVYYDSPSKSVYLYQNDASSGNGSGGATPSPAPTPTPTPTPTSTPGSGGTGSETPTPTPTPGSGGSTAPADATGLVTSIKYDGIGTTTIAYTGTVGDAQPFLMTGPDRIVMDIPAASFAADFANGFTATSAKMGEVVVDSQLLTKVRYSYYSDKPSTVRVVWDLQAAAEYTVTKGESTIQLSLLGALEPVPTTPTTPSGDKIFKVVVDAGHGAHDPGAIGISKKTEKSFNLAIALKVNALLKAEPRIQPILTRSDDTFIALDERAAIANRLNVDLFISIHANALPGSSASGTETYYNRADSKTFADIVHKHLLAATGLPDRKVQTAGFVVIKKTTMPAILTESGFLTNSKDEAILFNEQKQNEIAQALVDGIKEYLKLS